jgi:hypothetical protein
MNSVDLLRHGFEALRNERLTRLIASGRILEGSWAVCCSAPLGFSFFTRQGKCLSYTLCIEVFAVNRSSGLPGQQAISGLASWPLKPDDREQ